jgi:O-acetyl-ADP-ribose deacetylase
MAARIETILADITTLRVDAIVNAANESLLGGGGVDGAIHRAAGPELLARCRTLGGCSTGEARITPGYRLPASYVIHTVGPVWGGGNCREDELLARCYENCFALARAHGCLTIAFPSISTGAYRFPLARAARIAITGIRRGLGADPTIRHVTVACFDPATLEVYRSILRTSDEPEHPSVPANRPEDS